MLRQKEEVQLAPAGKESGEQTNLGFDPAPEEVPPPLPLTPQPTEPVGFTDDVEPLGTPGSPGVERQAPAATEIAHGDTSQNQTETETKQEQNEATVEETPTKPDEVLIIPEIKQEPTIVAVEPKIIQEQSLETVKVTPKSQDVNPTETTSRVANGGSASSPAEFKVPNPEPVHVPVPDTKLPVNSEKKEPPQDKQNPVGLEKIEDDQPERAVWGNQIEFLMSCIATSVGLGNVWRFPFVAYQNGGGAFLIPYVIVLFLIGKPMYYLECVLGQFSTRNSVKVWALSPAMKGTGYAQALGCGYILSYYVSIVALCLYYLIMSFNATLPWSVCQEEWGDICVPSIVSGGNFSITPNAISSAELYFVNTVLQQKDGIEGGLGSPIWYLTLCLFGSWLIIFLIIAQGVKSSGKAAYFLALFPYVIMLILLVRAVTLEGAVDGILFFLTPQWEKLLEINVWYAAVTQVFFSLSVCTGAIIMFSSYNGFRQNVYRDSMIVTTLDTFTSLLSGITIFGILGNLAFELGYDDVESVIGSGGTGLAFISYPDAIAKSPIVPQLFAVLFFLMMSVLGVGSAVALLSTINTVLLDSFPKIPTVYMSAFTSCCGFLVGLVYVTPGGQYILELVDYYGGTFLVLFAAISEIVGVFWIYGLENVCLDIEYMLGIKTSVYWRFCWGLITPGMMIAVFIYALISFEALVFGDGYIYPTAAYAAGYVMLFVGIAFVPLFIFMTMYKNRTGNFMETLKKSFNKKSSWGPRSAVDKHEWRAFKREAKEARGKQSKLKHIGLSLIGGYKR